MSKLLFCYYRREQARRADDEKAMRAFAMKANRTDASPKVLTKHLGIEISFATVQRTTRR